MNKLCAKYGCNSLQDCLKFIYDNVPDIDQKQSRMLV